MSGPSAKKLVPGGVPKNPLTIYLSCSRDTCGYVGERYTSAPDIKIDGEDFICPKCGCCLEMKIEVHH